MANSKPPCAWMRGSVPGTRAALALAVVLVAATAQSAQAQTFTVLYTFAGGTDGGVPNASLVRDAAGNLYSTTSVGGDLSCMLGAKLGCGTVFKLGKTGRETVLHRFTGPPDGADPSSGLTTDSAGNFYGATQFGDGTGCLGSGCGLLFKVTKAGKKTVLYTFTGGTDGYYPDGLIRDATGNLYGTTLLGGGTGCSIGCGSVFKVTKAGKETLLYRFTGGTDGAYPTGLIRDANGNFYGMAGAGGNMSDCNGSGCGVVFKLSKTGKETVLYKFTGGTDGGTPGAGLVRDQKGNLYGTTFYGGSGDGVVFKLAPNGKETVLHSFTGPPDGRIPGAGLLRDSAGNLYGTTEEGGDSNCVEGGGCGTIFKVDPTGKETVLYTFTGFPDGELPLAGLIMDASGALYGTTGFGGNSSSPCHDGTHITGCGVIFKLVP